MKEVITVKMVEQKEVKYIADDGKVFDKEYDCKKHEAERKSKEVNTTEINFNNLGNNKIKINNENCN